MMVLLTPTRHERAHARRVDNDDAAVLIRRAGARCCSVLWPACFLSKRRPHHEQRSSSK